MLYKLLIDILLVLGFAGVHSGLASFRAKALGKKILPVHIYRLVFSVIIASYILLAAYYWQAVDYVLYSIPSPWSFVLAVIVFVGWVMYFFCHLAYYEIGGVFGTSQLFSHSSLMTAARFDYSTNGLKKYIRFPVHTAFIPMFMAIPTMYASTLVFVIAMSLYAWLGTMHHDYRYTKLFKEKYIEYKKNSGMVFPRFNTSGIMGYNQLIYDVTPRAESISVIVLASILMITLSLWIIDSYGMYGINEKTSLIFIPVTMMVAAIITMPIVVLLLNNYRFTNNPEINMKRSESVAFGVGCAVAITLTAIYGYEFLIWRALPNLAAVIPAWVLSLLIMHSIYFLMEYAIWKLKVNKTISVLP